MAGSTATHLFSDEDESCGETLPSFTEIHSRDSAPPPSAFPSPLPSSGPAEAQAQVVRDTLTVSSSSSSSGSPERVRHGSAPSALPAGTSPALASPDRVAGPLRTPSAPLPCDPSRAGSRRRLHQRRGRPRQAHAHSHAHPRSHTHCTRTHSSLSPRSHPPRHTRCRRERQENEIYY